MQAAAARSLAMAVTLLSLTVLPVRAQQKKRQPGWKNSAEVSFLVTGGNARATTFGLKADSRRTWSHGELHLTGGAVRTQSTSISRAAVGTPTDFLVRETTDSRVTAESYYLHLQLDRDLDGGTFLFTRLAWDRNTFAGFRARYVVAAGAGRRWVDGNQTGFRTDLGLTYTVQHDIVDDPKKPDSFFGLRLSTELRQQITGNSTLKTQIAVDGNGREAADYRADSNNSLTVALSQPLALKTSVEFMYDNQPALRQVPLQLPSGEPAGQNVVVPLQRLDTVFTLALVISF